MNKKILLTIILLTTILIIPIALVQGDPIPGGSGQPVFYLEIFDGDVIDDDGTVIGEVECTENGNAILFVMVFPEAYPDFTYYGTIADDHFTIHGSAHAHGDATVEGDTIILSGTWFQ